MWGPPQGSGPAMTGTIRQYIKHKGFGFITCDNPGEEDVFTHFSYIIDAAGGDKDAGFAVGDKVAFELEIVDGKRQGKRVRVLSRGAEFFAAPAANPNVCKDFLHGRCMRGAGCKYLHEGGPQVANPALDPYYQQQQAAAGQYAGGAPPPPPNLPPGWTPAYDPASGAVYYINSQTGETQWHAPQVPPPPPQQQQQQQLVPPPPPATGMPQAPAAGWPPAEAAEPRAQGPPPQLLLGDVGGTNLRFALVPLWELRAATLPEATHRARYRTADFAQLREALARFTAEKPAELGQIVACTLSVCGPVSGGKAKCLAASMGADGWVLEEGALAAALNLQPGGVKLVNDFVAVGLAVAEVDWAAKAEARTTVHAGTPAEGGTVAVLGPGTGLGECFGVRLAGALHILPSEGGESDFVPRTADEWALREHVARSLGVTHVKVEHVVSGAGLKHIYDFLRSAGRKRKADSEGTADAVEEEVRAADDAGAAIAAHGDAAAEGADADCVAAVDMFVEALGAEAANLALRFQAFGGVYIAGGVTAKLAPRLAASEKLKAAYLGKGPSAELYSACPLHVVTTEGDDLAMEGAFRYAAKCGLDGR